MTISEHTNTGKQISEGGVKISLKHNSKNLADRIEKLLIKTRVVNSNLKNKKFDK